MASSGALTRRDPRLAVETSGHYADLMVWQPKQHNQRLQGSQIGL